MPAIGASVEKSLDDSLHKLLAGEIELSDLTPALQGWYVAGFVNGQQILPEDAHLRWEADLWYFVANNRGKTASDFYAGITTRLWEEASE